MTTRTLQCVRSPVHESPRIKVEMDSRFSQAVKRSGLYTAWSVAQ